MLEECKGRQLPMRRGRQGQGHKTTKTARPGSIPQAASQALDTSTQVGGVPEVCGAVACGWGWWRGWRQGGGGGVVWLGVRPSYGPTHTPSEPAREGGEQPPAMRRYEAQDAD